MKKKTKALGLVAVMTAGAAGYEANLRYNQPGPTQAQIDVEAGKCEVDLGQTIVDEQANLSPEEAAERRAFYGTEKMHRQLQRQCEEMARNKLGAPPTLSGDIRDGTAAILRLVHSFNHKPPLTPEQQETARANYVKDCQDRNADTSARLIAADPTQKSMEAKILPLEQTRCQYEGNKLFPAGKPVYGPAKPN